MAKPPSREASRTQADAKGRERITVEDSHALAADRRARLGRWGRDSWNALGIIAFVAVIALGLSAISGVVIPISVAVILGVLLQPFVYWMEKHRVSKTLAATTALLLAMGLGVALVALVIWGLVKELPEMGAQLTHGWNHFVAWVETWDVEGVWLERIYAQVTSWAPKLGAGVLGAATSTVSSTVTFLIAAFFAIFVMFYVLRDGQNFPGWVSRTVGYNEGVVDQVADVTTDALLGYFKSTAITALITAPIFIIPLMVLKVPLVIPIFLLYFFLSFIPYLGAFATGIFAVLIAFGSVGPMAALIVLIALLISNGAIQNAVLSWTMGSSLQIHPVTVLIATVVGGTVAGMIGMILGAPLAAAVLKSVKVVREYEAGSDQAGDTEGVPAS